MIVTSRKFIFIALASAPPRPYSSSAARQPAAELGYSPTKVEMQSVDDKTKSGVRVDRRRLCAPAARHIASLVLAAFFCTAAQCAGAGLVDQREAAGGGPHRRRG